MLRQHQGQWIRWQNGKGNDGVLIFLFVYLERCGKYMILGGSKSLKPLYLSIEILLIRTSFLCLPFFSFISFTFFYFIFGRRRMTLLSFGVCLQQLLANHNPSSRFSFEERFTNLSLLYKYLHLYLKEEEERAPHSRSQPPRPLPLPLCPPFLAFLFPKLKIVMCAGNEAL